jgi:hypothetical protein
MASFSVMLFRELLRAKIEKSSASARARDLKMLPKKLSSPREDYLSTDTIMSRHTMPVLLIVLGGEMVCFLALYSPDILIGMEV